LLKWLLKILPSIITPQRKDANVTNNEILQSLHFGFEITDSGFWFEKIALMSI